MIFCKFGESQEEKERWDEHILASPFGHIFQTYDWGEASRELRWQPLRYCVERENKISAAAQLLKREKGPWSILYVPRGPIFSDRDSFDFLMANLKDIIRENKAIFLKINPAIQKPSEIKDWYRCNNLVKSNVSEMHICTYLIDLAKNQDEIWSSFAHMVRKSIKKAEREDVVVERVENLSGFDTFYHLYENTFIKKNIKYHSHSFMKEVWERFNSKGQAEIFLAKHKDKAIAGLFILLYGNKCEEMWIGAIDKYLEFRPHQLLHWHIFCWLKEKGYTVYNMGGVPCDKKKLPGVQFYKQSFGGDFVEFLGEYELPGNPLLYCFWRKLGKIYINRRIG